MLHIDKYSAYWKIAERIKPRSIVLDVGCGRGNLGEFLIRTKKCLVYGIDISEEYAFEAMSRGYEYVAVLDLDRIDRFYVPFRQESFDYIVYADVLEHLKDPLKVLIALKPLLKEHGSIICSIPNVAVWSVRLKLLLGKWEYEDYGILDRTHLRFFTIRTARKLIEEAGFRIIYEDYTPYFPNVSRKTVKTLHNANRRDTIVRRAKNLAKEVFNFLVKVRPSLFACQIIIEAKPIK